MAEKAPTHPLSDQQNNVLVYSVGSEYQGNASTLQTPVNQNKHNAVYYHSNKFDPSAGVSVDSVRPVLVESVCSSTCSSVDNGLTVSSVDNENCEYKPEAISPPFGWKRILSNGIIVYISPSNTALSSLEQVKCYVQSDGTCKCGLECPLHIPLVFNFDPKVLTKPYTPTVIAPGDLNKLCNHKRKLIANMEILSNDSRYGAADVLRRKKRRVVAPAGVNQGLIGNSQVASTTGPAMQQGQHGVVASYQGINSPMGIPHGATMQHAPTVQTMPQGGSIPPQTSIPPGLNLPPGVSFIPGSSVPQQSPSPVPIGLPPGNSMVGVHPGQSGSSIGVSNNPALLNLPQGVNMQPNSNPMAMQQNVILGLPQNPPNQVGVHQAPSPLGVQQNIASLGMQSNAPFQQSTLMQQAASVSPSPSASPALSQCSGSLPPPSPLSTRMTPPIPMASSSSRSDLHNPQFVKMQQQIPSQEVWREGNYPNGYIEYMGSSGGGMLSQSPSTSQDSTLFQQHQIHGSPSPDLSSTIGTGSSQSEEVQSNLSVLSQNPMLAQNMVQSNSPVPQASNLSLVPPSSQVLSQVVQSGQELSVSVTQSSIPVPQVAQPNMVRRFPVQIPSHSPSPQSSHTPYQLNSQPVQIQYENNRVCPPGYSLKYSKKSNSHIQQQQVIGEQHGTLNHPQPQVITSYPNNIQSSSQQFSHQQVVSNHQLIVSSQQNNSQQQIVNTHQNIDQTSIAVQQNIHGIVASKQHQSSSQVHCVSNQEIGSNSSGSIGRVRTPPWHQNKRNQQESPQIQTQPVEKTTWSRKSKSKDGGSPSFLEDPSGYLAQQTAMLRQVVAGREEEEGPKTMASGHTASSNTLTSVLAGRTNTLTVSVGSQEPKPQQQHILVSSGNGQFIIAAAPKVNPPSPLLLPAPLLLQHIDTVQLPQLVVPPTIHEDVVEKRKSPNKKRKLSPTTSTTTMLLSPQPQQQVLTILPGKTPIANMIQPLNVVQNFPIQQFLVPSMVMSDGTILQDTVQVNLLPSAGVFSGGQNLLTPTSVVLRAPTTSQPQAPQHPKFIHSPNQFVNFSGDLSSQVVPTTTNTTVVQQNTTTIVQQTTMVQQPSPSYILDKPNFILAPDKNNFIINPNGNNGNSDKGGRAGYVRNSVSTQTQNQVVQASSSGPGGIVVTTTSSRGSSPPDTTTLSPADQEVSTSVTSPDPSMVHCVSSSNLQDDSSPYHIDTTTSSLPYHSGNGCKPVGYDEASYMHQPLQDKDISQMNSDDCSGKMICTTTSSGSPLNNMEQPDGMVN